jgi:hypothetical protein
MHWSSPIFCMEAKFGHLDKRIKNYWHRSRLNFSEKQFGTAFLTTNKSEILEELKVEPVEEKLKRYK